MHDLIGRQLGQYQIISSFGEGGMATVFKAYQASMERYVALKVLPYQLAREPEFVGRFHQEAKIIANLQHAHILPVFDFGEVDGYTFLVMPFIPTGTLSDKLQGRPLPLEETKKYIHQLSDALDYAHSKGVLHRDIKPSNVLIDERDNCLLTDFGVAKIMEGVSNLTQSGSFIGTPAYMSPEQMMGHTLDHRSDIYSLGIILYEMATGRQPYKAETPAAIVLKVMNDPLPMPQDINPSLPDAIQEIILKALTRTPQERYHNAKTMSLALEQAVDASNHFIPNSRLTPSPDATQLYTTPTVTEKPIPSNKRSVQTWQWGLGALAILFVIILLGWFGISQRNQIFLLETQIAQTATAAQQPLVENPTATHAPESPSVVATQLPTETPSPDLLFSDNFEEGLNNWGGGRDWEIIEDETGNHVLQATNPEDWEAIQVGSMGWRNYALAFRARIIHSSGDISTRQEEIRASVRFNWQEPQQNCERYEITFGTTGTSLMMKDGALCPWHLVAQESIFIEANKWSDFRIELFDNQVSVFVNNQFAYAMQDDHPISAGQIAFAAPPGVIVQYDDVEVTTLTSITQVAAFYTPIPTETALPSPTPLPTVVSVIQPDDLLAPRIAYAFPLGDIYYYDQDGVNRRITATDEEEFTPVWSPDGKQLVFQRFTLNQNNGDLWIRNVITQEESQLTFFADDNKNNFMPAWSPSGDYIVFVHHDTIAEIRPDGTGFRAIIPGSPSIKFGPTISPDGTQIAFNETLPQWDHPGPFTPTIVIVNRDGSNRRVIHIGSPRDSKDAEYHYFPVWSPDGQSIGFREQDGLTYVVPADGQALPQPTSQDITSWYPTYWPQWHGETSAPNDIRASVSLSRAAEAIASEPNSENIVLALTAVLDSPPDYQDDFSSPATSVIGANDEGGGFARFENGTYVMTAPMDGWSNTWTGTPLFEHQNIAVQVDVLIPDAIPSAVNSGGIFLRWNPEFDYSFEIDYGEPEAHAQIILHDHRSSESIITSLSERQPVDSFAGSQTGTWHTLLAIVSGNQLAYFVDGTLAAIITDETITRGSVLIGVGGGTEMHIDNLRLWLLDS